MRLVNECFGRVISSTSLHGLVGLAGAEDDFLGDFDEGDKDFLSSIFGLMELRLPLVDLVETLEDRFVEPERNLFLFEVWPLNPFSNDRRAESMASFRPRL